MILIVHGYEFRPNYLGRLNLAVCRKVAELHQYYKWIIMTGGWFFGTMPPRPTIAEAMRKELIKMDVPIEKLLTQFSIPGGEKVLPPRDCIEDVDLLGNLLGLLGFQPKEIYFDALCVWFMKPRVKFLYSTRKARCQKVIVAFFFSLDWDVLRKILTEFIAFPLMLFDPQGKSWPVKKTRGNRTCKFEKGQFPQRNLPRAWE